MDSRFEKCDLGQQAPQWLGVYEQVCAASAIPIDDLDGIHHAHAR